jgi:hypothetical protein
MGQERDDQLNVRGCSDDAQNLDRGPDHDGVVELESPQCNSPSSFGEVRNLRGTLFDELAKKMEITRAARMASVPLEFLPVRSVEDEPLPDGVARFGYEMPRWVGTVISHIRPSIPTVGC